MPSPPDDSLLQSALMPGRAHCRAAVWHSTATAVGKGFIVPNRCHRSATRLEYRARGWRQWS
jgi:hypothetical protein